MTLETCKIRLELAKRTEDKKGRKLIVNPVEVKFWEDRILQKTPKESEVKTDGKKSKR